MSDKRLYKSNVNYMICGVCGGIAEYLAVDPTLIRLAWVIFTCLSAGTGSSLILLQRYYSKLSILLNKAYSMWKYSIGKFCQV